MPVIRKTIVLQAGGNVAGNGDFKIQPASDGSGEYVPVVALDADLGVSIGSVSQQGTWTVTANAGTNLNTSALALETGGNLATIAGAVSGGRVQTAVATALPAGSNTIGAVNQGTSPWIVQQSDNRAVDQSINAATSNAAVTVTLNGGEGEVGFTITGLTGSGATVTFEGSNNIGAASPVWGAINAVSGAALMTTATADGSYRVEAGGRTAVRVRVSSTGTGTITVSYSGSSASSLVTLAQSLPTGSNVLGGFTPAPSSSSSFAIVPGSSSALESSHVLKASPGTLYSLYVVTGATAGYLMTFNATSVPADGAVVPVECIPVPANSIVSIGFSGAPPDFYSTGIVAAFSSTGPFTKTASATAFFKWRVQ